MDVSARSLILDLLSTLRKGAMPVRALIRAGELFDIPENTLRVALARLLQAGRVDRDERGQYRLGEAAQAVNRRVTGWRDVEDRLLPWGGDWAAVMTAGLPRGDRAAVRRSRRALGLLGFQTLEPGLEVRPDNLVGGVAALRHALRGLGLDAVAPIARLTELDSERDARARGLWDGESLAGSHRAARLAIEQSGERLAALPAGEAMVESFRLGGAALRNIALDPLLPDALAPGDERRRLIAAMKRYDVLGREAWRALLEHHGVTHLRAPLDTRETDRPLAARAASGGAR